MAAASYDTGIVGGGLAGLSLAIQLARKGRQVIVFEKEQYPFHRVCGEYISMESWDFIRSLGLDLDAMKVSRIKKLQVSGRNGKLLEQPLPLGGFGISRYRLDATLAGIARSAGVVLKENTKVNDIRFSENHFIITAGAEEYKAKTAAGSFGKRSNIDIKWKRPFAIAAKNGLNNYIGVKYHIRPGFFPGDTIALHTFSNGYCGIVKIEDDIYNLCYLTTADNLKKSGGSILQMEQAILSGNPLLKNILEESVKCEALPITISQISFDRKSQVENHVLLLGDAAGMIAPLCGNGMSMALHGSKLAAIQIDLFLNGDISRKEMETSFVRQWRNHFSGRLQRGRVMQRLLGNRVLTHFFIHLGRHFPVLIKWMIRQTHGKPF